MKHDPHSEDDFKDFIPEDEENSIVVNIAGIIIGTFIVIYCVFQMIANYI